MIRVRNSVLTHPGITTHREWEQTNPANLVAAAQARHEYHRGVKAANGNASDCRTWVEVDGKPVDTEMLPDTLREAANVLALLS